MARCRVLVVSKGNSSWTLDVSRSGSANVANVISAEDQKFSGFFPVLGLAYSQAPLDLKAKVRSH